MKFIVLLTKIIPLMSKACVMNGDRSNNRSKHRRGQNNNDNAFRRVELHQKVHVRDSIEKFRQTLC